MPILKNAIKKVRVDKRRTAVNRRAKTALKEALDQARKNPTTKSVAVATRAVAMAVKKKIIHRNKGSRLVSRLARKIVVKISRSSNHKPQVTNPK